MLDIIGVLTQVGRRLLRSVISGSVIEGHLVFSGGVLRIFFEVGFDEDLVGCCLKRILEASRALSREECVRSRFF